MPQGWKEAAAAKRDSVNALIPDAWRIKDLPARDQLRDVSGDYIRKLLTADEVKITETGASAIASKIALKEWRATEVTKAFCHRAALVHQLTNCLLEIFFNEGIRQAEHLDEYQDKHGKTVGPLHGVPISLKDQFHIPGIETTMGYVGWIGTFEGKKGTGKDKVSESELAKELRQSGAVFFCKTSVPHTLMAPETVNNIMGYCWNAKNRLLSSGGSSGGEGVLIASHGSPLGFGTDIGGSIRIPAACNGIYGIRPSTGRIPYEGMANSFDGQGTVLSVVGPLATSIADIVLVTRTVLAQEPWLHDPLVHELPWRDEQYTAIKNLAQGLGNTGKLAFGVVRSDGIVTPHPPVRRGIALTVSALQHLGHDVIEWQDAGASHNTVAKAAMAAYGYDGGSDAWNAFGLSGEPMSEQVKLIFPERKPEMNATEIAANNVYKRQVTKDYLEAWNGTKHQTKTGRPIDALISPVAQHAAPVPEKYMYLGYTTWVNVVDYTSVVVPVTECDKAVDKADTDFKPIDDRDEKIHKLYDPELFDKTPVCVQIIGRRLQEEKTLAIAEVVDEAVKAQKRRQG